MDIHAINSIFDSQTEHAQKIASLSFKQRKKRLKLLLKTVRTYESKIVEALHRDMRKHEVESKVSELLPFYSEINHAIHNLKTWMKNKSVPTPIILLGGKSYIHPEPKGNVLIIAPWNYPFNLVMCPLISALAAGNVVIIKPSEFTPNINQVLKEIIDHIFPVNEVAIIEGAVEVSQHLLSLPFNHIFFTGSPQIGKIVMKSAANHLASVTLELGGKSSVIVDETANIKTAVARLVWAKCMNNGQTCLAPDYLLIHESRLEDFKSNFRDKINRLYGKIEDSESYSRIVNRRHFDRIQSLLNDDHGGEIIAFGTSNVEDHYIPPALVVNPSMDSRIMQEEIFGPLLPIVTFASIDEAIQIINSKEHALANYIYSSSQKNLNRLMTETRSGAVCINTNMVHFGNSDLPFGGSNHSGIGRSHGRAGFESFSNMKSVYHQLAPWSTIRFFRPPFSPLKNKLIDFVMRWLS